MTCKLYINKDTDGSSNIRTVFRCRFTGSYFIFETLLKKRRRVVTSYEAHGAEKLDKAANKATHS
jgi:hypothetical protein